MHTDQKIVHPSFISAIEISQQLNNGNDDASEIKYILSHSFILRGFWPENQSLKSIAVFIYGS